MACGRADLSSDLTSEKLAESLSSFVSVDEDASSICEMDAGNSNVINILYGLLCCKKNKLKWVGSLEDLKAFVLAEVDEDVIKSTTWRSPSGGTWKFENKMLSVTWYTKSQNIYFEGEKSKDVITRIISFLKQSEHASEHTSVNTQCTKGEAIETELRIVEPISNSCCQTSKHSTAECEETISVEDGNVMEECVGAASAEYHERSDGAVTSTQCINTNSQVIVHDSPDALQQEVSAIKFKLNQHVDETRTELQQIKENFEYQLDQLKESYSLPEKINTKCCRTFLEHENARLRRENAQLKEENNTLKERFNDCSYTVSDLKTKLENIENEKRSLHMAIKLLHDDNNSTLANNRQSTCSTWQVPKINHGKQ